MNFAHEAVHQLITGMSGKGKSTFSRAMVARDRAPWKFAFDTFKKEYTRFLGWPLCIDEPAMKRALLAGRPSAFYAAPLFPGDRPEGFNFWIRWVYEMGKQLPGRKLVIIEEVEKTTAHVNTPLSPAFAEMLDEGRAAQFDVMLISQRLSSMNRNIRTTLTDICTFQHTDPDELDWLKRERFDCAAVEKLVRGEYIWKDREAGTFRTNAKRKAIPQPARK